MIYGIPVCSSKQIVRCKYIAKRYPEESIARWGVRRLHVSTCVPDVFRKRVAVLKRTRHPCNRCAIVSIFNCIKFHPRVRFKIYPFHFSSSSFFFFTRFRLRATTTHWLEKGHFFPNSNTFFFSEAIGVSRRKRNSRIMKMILEYRFRGGRLFGGGILIPSLVFSSRGKILIYIYISRMHILVKR